jgi:hypothetical protein
MAAVMRSPEPILVTILACPIANATENPSLMIGGTANIFTKVGNDTTVAIMLAGYANIFTHVGDGFSAALSGHMILITSQPVFQLLNVVCFAEKQQIPIL